MKHENSPMNDIRQVKMKNRFICVIIAILLAIIVSPFIRHTGKAGYLFDTFLAAMIPLTCFYALTADRKRAIIILFIAAPFVILDGMNMFFANRYLMIAAYSFATILYIYIVALLVQNLLSYRVITADLIYCAISTYFLIGIMWTGVYIVLEGISPGSFSGISEAGDLLYFSFVTLTTVGFGDIAPQSILCKRLAVFEAAMAAFTWRLLSQCSLADICLCGQSKILKAKSIPKNERCGRAGWRRAPRIARRDRFSARIRSFCCLINF